MRGRHNHLPILPAVADLPERINMGGVILLGFVKNGVHRTQLFVVQAVRFLDCSIHDVVHRRIQLMDSSHFVDLCSSAFSTRNRRFPARLYAQANKPAESRCRAKANPIFHPRRSERTPRTFPPVTLRVEMAGSARDGLCDRLQNKPAGEETWRCWISITQCAQPCALI